MASFYAARTLRIFPALAVVITATLIAGWLMLLPEEYAALGRHALWGAGFVMNLGLLGEQGYFDTATELKPLMHLWSLAIEEQFYLLFPAGLWATWRYRRNPMTLVLLILALSFALNVFGVIHHATRTFFMPSTRFWELMVGAALALISLGKHCPDSPHTPTCWQRNSFVPSRLPSVLSFCHNHLGTAGALLLLISVLMTPAGGKFPGWWAAAPVAGAAMAIGAGPSDRFNRLLLAAQPLRMLGLISYPLYLWHWPVLAFMKIVLSETPSVTLRILGLSASVVLATLTYIGVEKPIRYGTRSARVVRRLLIVMSLIALAGLVTKHEEGWTMRAAIQVPYAQSQAFHFHRPRNPDCDSRHPTFSGSGYCELSRTGAASPKVVILGDSHSNMLYWGFADVLQNKELTVANFGHPACLPFLDISARQRGETDDCAKTMNEAIRLAANLREANTVILAARGPLYLSGLGYGAVPSEQRLDMLLRDTSDPRNNNHKKIFTDGLARTLAYLKAHDKQVIFVIDLPELGFSPQACIARPFRPAANSACSLAYSDYMARAGEYRKLVEEVISHHSNTILFDAATVFCDRHRCQAKDEDEMLYRDSDHPSLAGAIRIAKKND